MSSRCGLESRELARDKVRNLTVHVQHALLVSLPPGLRHKPPLRIQTVSSEKRLSGICLHFPKARAADDKKLMALLRQHRPPWRFLWPNTDIQQWGLHDYPFIPIIPFVFFMVRRDTSSIDACGLESRDGSPDCIGGVSGMSCLISDDCFGDSQPSGTAA